MKIGLLFMVLMLVFELWVEGFGYKLFECFFIVLFNFIMHELLVCTLIGVHGNGE